jgi:hypothetical protein
VNTYFARHTENLTIDDESRLALFNAQRIAIHYPCLSDDSLGDDDNASLLEVDYPPNGRRALRALKRLAYEGGYVCAEHFQQTKVQIGWIAPESSIELVNATWHPLSLCPKRRAVLKTLALKKVRILSAIDSAVVLAGRPRMGTLQRWEACGSRIEHLVEGTHSQLSLSDLLSYEQETMCAEFLRTTEAETMGLPRLANLLVPIGRTMKDVDILGIASDGEKIACQVTFSTLGAAGSKVNALKPYVSKHRPICFCNETDNSLVDGAHIVSMQRVFDIFTSTASGIRWLSALRVLF